MCNTKWGIDEIFTEGHHSFWDEISRKIGKGQSVYLFGAGEFGILVNDILKNMGYKVAGFLDNDPKKWNSNITEDTKCISIEDFLHAKDTAVVIITSAYYNLIKKQLLALGFSNIIVAGQYNYISFHKMYNKTMAVYIKERFWEVMNILEDEESKRILVKLLKSYFSATFEQIDNSDICSGRQGYADIIQVTDQETFVDCGAYDGDTIRSFLQESKGLFNEIHAFELDKNNFRNLLNTVNGLDDDIKKRIFTYNLGLWDKNEKILYSNKGNDASRISKDGEVYGIVDSIDNILQNKSISLIKMDIEGAELRTLKGAQNILKTHKPKLAISIYHNFNDLWEIPLYIKKIVPEYKIYIRHHTNDFYETMCYAVK